MQKGVVKFFSEDGYGFVECEHLEEDVYVHMNDVSGPDLEEGQHLQFRLTENDHGFRARNVHRI